jgi:hypothetical protein
MMPITCDSCEAKERRHDTGLCKKCEDAIVIEFGVPARMAGVALMARRVAMDHPSPTMEGLDMRARVRRMVIAYGGDIDSATEQEMFDADKVRKTSDYAGSLLGWNTKRAQRDNPAPTGPDQKMAQSGNRWD